MDEMEEAAALEYVEDALAERAAVKGAIASAKRFRQKLEAAGISYSELLDLIKERHALDATAENILMGMERGEVWA